MGSGHMQMGRETSGASTQGGEMARGRKFMEGPHPVVSTADESASDGGRHEGKILPPDRMGLESGGASKGDILVAKECSDDKREDSKTMNPPSLPPPSRLKEAVAMMPPPPSLPPRFAKGTFVLLAHAVYRALKQECVRVLI